MIHWSKRTVEPLIIHTVAPLTPAVRRAFSRLRIIRRRPVAEDKYVFMNTQGLVSAVEEIRPLRLFENPLVSQPRQIAHR